jgi:Uncharacterised protein family
MLHLNLDFNIEGQLFENLKEKIQTGLSLSDIENDLVCIVCLRFMILSVRYNLKTSFYITCISLVAGYLWYRHLIDLISIYRNVLFKVPFFHSLGMDGREIQTMNKKVALIELKLGENISFFNPGEILYYAIIKKGIIHVDPETGFRYYMDPLSMLISKLDEPYKSKILPIYYEVYNTIIPRIYELCSKFWNQLSLIASYTFITRIGKKYCPYLIRWHWTFVLIIGLIENILFSFIFRVNYFQRFVLLPKTRSTLFDGPRPFGFANALEFDNFEFQLQLSNAIIAVIVCTHIGFIIFGLFHAILGQYFYAPFLVENIELHVGPRPKNSIYSGGFTSWQDYDETKINRLLPKLWFGWFGKASKPSRLRGLRKLRNLILKLIKKLRKKFQ